MRREGSLPFLAACLAACLGPNPNAGGDDDGTGTGTETSDDTGQTDTGTDTGAGDMGVPDPTCDDDDKNGDETDVDCGGDDCGPCEDGDGCDDADDCASKVCDGTCVPASCDDEVLNGEEAAVDCGGTCAVCVLDELNDEWVTPDEDLETQPAVHILPDGRFAIAWVTVALDIRFRWFGPEAQDPSDGFLAHGATVPEERSPVVRIRDGDDPELALAYLDANPPDGPDVILRRFDGSGGATSGPVAIDGFSDMKAEGYGFDLDGDRVAFAFHAAGSLMARRYDLEINDFLDQQDLDVGATVAAETVSVAYADDDSFAVAWADDQGDFDFDAYTRLRTAGGAWADPPGPANAALDGVQTDPVIAHLSDGGFVVAWSGATDDDPSGGIGGRLLDATGTPVGEDIQINEILVGAQERPSVVALADGFAVAWQDVDTETIRLRRFANDASPKHDDEAAWGSTADLQPQAPALTANDEQIILLWAAGDPDVEIVGVRLAY